MRNRLLAVLSLVMASFSTADAQVVDPGRDSARARAIERLEIGAELRLVAAGHSYRGFLVRRNALELTLDRNGSELRVPRMQIQALWEPTGRATTDCFLMGAILGGVAGGTAGWYYPFFCEENCAPRQSLHAALGAVAGTLAVGFAGALIGSAFETWERRFP